MAPPAEADAFLYVSREDAGFRHVVNEAELFEELEPLGFRKIVPGRLGVAEQIREFSAASMVVAVHGAALTNTVFSPAHAAVVEINNSKLQSMDDFRRIAKAVGQRFQTIVSDVYADPHAPAHVNSNYVVDIDEVLRCVGILLREQASRPSASDGARFLAGRRPA
jgi:capsular polysaccharide biosynthesis protein